MKTVRLVKLSTETNDIIKHPITHIALHKRSRSTSVLCFQGVSQATAERLARHAYLLGIFGMFERKYLYII
jgi:hypothetical protein